ncbi:unnamed protein product [Didymodactylos carnosus]|uniref:Uncharacterized protein n=1 Tax=Didymodactylos carnosus TaxID=1234261 RepID=A0A814B4N5_9BILA|nr:unnamed protein product [Didymodactylos carnosus]CAF0923581.1 unnamed protein product [Didymodactylos carnosus]CAF3586104.1 unnamed protein product [Didymodactylos carnosus]CAF3702569.1 unnamed protein product [Didymodactylos carnosus]
MQKYITTSTNDFGGGDYRIVEKEYADRKVIYHIPIEYGDEYDLNDDDDETTFEQSGGSFLQPQPTRVHKQHQTQLRTKRQTYNNYADVDQNHYYEDDDPYDTYELIQYGSRSGPRRQIIKKNIVVEEDNGYDDNQIEYVVEERSRPQSIKHVQRPMRRVASTVVDDKPQFSQRPPPRTIVHENVKPVTNQGHRIKAPFNNPLPPPAPAKNHLNTHSYEETMQIILANRAKRGSKLPKPKREVEQAKFYDPPQPSKNIVRNGFIVHK